MKRLSKGCLGSLVPMMILIAFFRVGCAGCVSWEYSYPLIGDWYFTKSSDTTAKVGLRAAHGPRTPKIPAMITRLAWNDYYIIAQQQDLVAAGRTNVDTGEYDRPTITTNWWILDLTDYEKPKRYGPLDLSEFHERVRELDLQSLKLRPTRFYRWNTNHPSARHRRPDAGKKEEDAPEDSVALEYIFRDERSQGSQGKVKGSRLHCASEVQRKGEVSNGSQGVTSPDSRIDGGGELK
jgi:hypothetical protein